MTLNCFHVFGDLGIVIGQHSPSSALASTLVHSWEVVFGTHAELEGMLRAGDGGAPLHPRVALRTLAVPWFLKLDDKTSSLPDWTTFVAGAVASGSKPCSSRTVRTYSSAISLPCLWCTT